MRARHLRIPNAALEELPTSLGEILKPDGVQLEEAGFDVRPGPTTSVIAQAAEASGTQYNAAVEQKVYAPQFGTLTKLGSLSIQVVKGVVTRMATEIWARSLRSCGRRTGRKT